MDLILAIGTGIGLAAAAGIRPFLPVLLNGALASGDVLVDFDGTDWAFLESPGFLGAFVALLIVTTVFERGQGTVLDTGPYGAALAGIAIGAGALLFAGALADEGETAWPGIPAGLACAALGRAAVGDLIARAAARLDAEAKGALPVYADAISVVTAGLALGFGPLSLIVIGFLIALLIKGRQREGEKYAGLRILR